MGIDDRLQFLLISPRIGVPMTHNKTGVPADSVAYGLVDSQNRMGINDSYVNPVLIEMKQLSEPFRETGQFLSQIFRILFHVQIQDFFLDTCPVKDQTTSAALDITGQDFGDNLNIYWFHVSA